MKRSDNVGRNGGGSWKAVIVEPSIQVAEGMIRQLEARGFQVAARLDRANHAAVEARVHKVDLLILEVGEDGEAALKMIEELSTESRRLKVIVTAPAAEADLILRALRAGATEFLVKPISAQDFAEAISRVVRSLTPRREANGQVLAVYSAKGGLGTTTVAVNLAFSLARKHRKKRVALIDTVMHGGDVKVFLDMNPRYTLSDLLGKSDNIDTQFLEKVLYNHPDGVWVLPEPGHPEDVESIDGEEMSRIISRMRSEFDFVIVDCEHQLTSRTTAILDAADKIVLLSILSVPAVRQLQRTLDTFSQLAYPESKVSIVVNRHQTNDVLKVRDLEKSFGRPVHWRLPNDYKVAIDAITRGKPLVMGAPRSKLAQSMDRLAITLNNSDGNDGSSALGKRMRRLLLKGQRG